MLKRNRITRGRVCAELVYPTQVLTGLVYMAGHVLQTRPLRTKYEKLLNLLLEYIMRWRKWKPDKKRTRIRHRIKT